MIKAVDLIIFMFRNTSLHEQKYTPLIICILLLFIMLNFGSVSFKMKYIYAVMFRKR